MRQELAAERRHAAQQQQLQLEERRDENERVFQAWMARKQGEKFLFGSKHDAKDKKLQSETRRLEAQHSYDQWLRRKRQECRNRTGKNHKKWGLICDVSDLIVKFMVWLQVEEQGPGQFLRLHGPTHAAHVPHLFGLEQIIIDFPLASMA